jgi:N-acetylmuramoyl-L-alanine amidase
VNGVVILPEAWRLGAKALPSGWWSEHASGLMRVWPDAPEAVARESERWGLAEALFVCKIENEQTGITRAWGSTTLKPYACLGAAPTEVLDVLREQGVLVGLLTETERWSFYWLVGVDKPRASTADDWGCREDGWYGPALQLAGLGYRFGCAYPGVKPSAGQLAGLPPVPHDLAGFTLDPATYSPGKPVERAGQKLTPANWISAYSCCYMASLPGQTALREIGLRWFAGDYANEEEGARGGDGVRKRIVLDAGHPPGGGARGVGGDEAALNGLVRDALRSMLEAAGHEVLLAPRTNSVTSIGKWSAERRPDVFLSIHHNAGDASARGSECYCAGEEFGGPEVAPNGKALARAVVGAVMAGLSLPAHGSAVRTRWVNPKTGKFARLSVLSGGDNWAVSGAACLIEMAFVSNKKDAAVTTAADYPRRAAEALFLGIQAYLGASVGVPPTTEPAAGATGAAASTVAEYTDLVRRLQALLRAAGHDPGEVDGLLGPHTLAAAEGFQHANDL